MAMISWGIIGCGDVTEVKSGPAFNKVPNSRLVAVMRRDREKLMDFAKRHNVGRYYSDAYELINDPEINAIYVATPPLQHEEYAIAALQAGKAVYIEKPMAVNASAAQRIADAAAGKKVTVAHYRRAQPMFLKLKELLTSNIIGKIRFVDVKYLQAPLSAEDLKIPKVQWRVNPAIAGGGLFHDLAPHQLDLMLYFFGQVETALGVSGNQAGLYEADDIVSANIRFGKGILFQGLWCFTVAKEEEKDLCEVTGSEGKISFSFFSEPVITITKKGTTTTIPFERLHHVQQPMIEKVVQYFLDQGINPSSPDDGVEVMRLMEVFTKNKYGTSSFLLPRFPENRI